MTSRATPPRAASNAPEDGHKKALKRVRNISAPKKISGTVLLSHSQLYSTIAAGVLNYRVREGNVCDSSAMDTGKNNKRKCEKKGCRESCIGMDPKELREQPFSHGFEEPMRKKVVKPHGRLVMVS